MDTNVYAGVSQLNIPTHDDNDTGCGPPLPVVHYHFPDLGHNADRQIFLYLPVLFIFLSIPEATGHHRVVRKLLMVTEIRPVLKDCCVEDKGEGKTMVLCSASVLLSRDSDKTVPSQSVESSRGRKWPRRTGKYHLNSSNLFLFPGEVLNQRKLFSLLWWWWWWCSPDPRGW